MTKTNRKSHRLIALLAAGSVTLGAYTFGIITSPGTTRGAGISTSPGGRAAASNIQKTKEAHSTGLIKNTQALTSRKAGKGQQEY